MRKALLAAVVVVGLFALATPNASAATAVGLLSQPTQDNVVTVYYRWHGQHWHHRSMNHGHWHYWN
jgi:hypothetical protein